MSDTLRSRLIRNIHDVELNHDRREPLYDSRGARVSTGTAATKLGAGYDVLSPGMRSCPYHYHLAQEELFIVLEGEGTLRVADQMLPVKAGDMVFIPPGPEYPHQFINTSAQPMRYVSISTQERPEVCYYPRFGQSSAPLRRATAWCSARPMRWITGTVNPSPGDEAWMSARDGP